MKIGIIGGGISGLSVGKLLKDKFDIEILESKNRIGGIAHAKNIDGVAYHTIGGHCFNSKYDEVLNFVFNDILHKEDWHKVTRRAKIFFEGHYIDYPIEYSVKEIAKFDVELAINIVNDFFAPNIKSVTNLEDWFIAKFGKTLAEKYFIPYNNKIWGTHPRNMNPLWVDGKLPIPNKSEFTKGLFDKQTDNMPHSFFYYPNENTQNQFIKALSKNLNISLDYKVESIKNENKKWIINGEKSFDLIISTMPLNILPNNITYCPSNIF